MSVYEAITNTISSTSKLNLYFTLHPELTSDPKPLKGLIADKHLFVSPIFYFLSLTKNNQLVPISAIITV